MRSPLLDSAYDDDDGLRTDVATASATRAEGDFNMASCACLCSGGRLEREEGGGEAAAAAA